MTSERVVIIQSPFLEPDAEKDLKVVFKGAAIASINAWAFEMCSKQYHDDHSMRVIRIESDVRIESVREFLAGCQSREMRITLENADELLELCDEWQVACVAKEVEAFISDNSESMLIRMILRARRRCLPTSELEKTLHREFLNHRSNPKIFKLGIEILFRVFKINNHSLVREHLHDVFEFLVQSLEVFGSSGSILFSGVSVEDLSAAEMHRLRSIDNFDFGIMNGSMFDTICDQRTVIARLIEQHSADQAEMTQFRSDTNTRLSNVETELRSELEASQTRLRDELMAVLQQKLESSKTEIDSRAAVLTNDIIKLRTDMENNNAELLRSSSKSVETMTERLQSLRNEVQQSRSETAHFLDAVRADVQILKKDAAAMSSNLSNQERQLSQRIESLGNDERKTAEMLSRLAETLGAYIGSPFSGIFANMSTKCGGNPHDKGVINVTAGSLYNHGKGPHQILDYDGNGFCDFHQWVVIDFKSARVSPSHYSLKSSDLTNYNPVQWAIEGSNDDSNWAEIDSRNTQDLVPADAVHTYPIDWKGPVSSFRYIRIRRIACKLREQNGKSKCFGIAHFELFGFVTHPSD